MYRQTRAEQSKAKQNKPFSFSFFFFLPLFFFFPLKMEIFDSNSHKFSYLSLLMAPEETLSPDDQLLLSDFKQTSQNHSSTPSSFPFSQNPFSGFQQNPEIQIPFSDCMNDFETHQSTNTNTHFLPPLPELFPVDNAAIKAPSSNTHLLPPFPELLSFENDALNTHFVSPLPDELISFENNAFNTHFLAPLPETLSLENDAFNTHFMTPLPETLSLENDAFNTHFVAPLPELVSLENADSIKAPSISTTSNTYSSSPPEKDDYTLDSIVASYLHFQSSKSSSQKTKQRRQRKKISDKVNTLKKLLPRSDDGNKRCTADILKQAHKYIQFLQAQVEVLKHMPNELLSLQSSQQQLNDEITDNVRQKSKFCRCGSNSETDETTGLLSLRRMSREEVLQTVVNSSAAQVVMAENGWCVFSEEQVDLIIRVYARQKIVDHLLSSLPL